MSGNSYNGTRNVPKKRPTSEIILILLLLSVVGIALTDLSPTKGYWYWMAIGPVFCGATILIEWSRMNRQREQGKAHMDASHSLAGLSCHHLPGVPAQCHGDGASQQRGCGTCGSSHSCFCHFRRRDHRQRADLRGGRFPGHCGCGHSLNRRIYLGFVDTPGPQCRRHLFVSPPKIKTDAARLIF